MKKLDGHEVIAELATLGIGSRFLGGLYVFSESTSRGTVLWIARDAREFYVLQGIVGRLVLRRSTHYYNFRVVEGQVEHHMFSSTQVGEAFDPQFVGFLDGSFYYLSESGESIPLVAVPRDFYES